MPSYASGRGLFVVIGLFACVAGMIVSTTAKNDYTSEAYLKIYENHIEGKQLNPRKEFSISIADVYSVKTVDFAMNEFLVIKTAREQYTVLVSDPQKAQGIINAKLDELEKI